MASLDGNSQDSVLDPDSLKVLYNLLHPSAASDEWHGVSPVVKRSIVSINSCLNDIVTHINELSRRLHTTTNTVTSLQGHLAQRIAAATRAGQPRDDKVAAGRTVRADRRSVSNTDTARSRGFSSPASRLTGSLGGPPAAHTSATTAPSPSAARPDTGTSGSPEGCKTEPQAPSSHDLVLTSPTVPRFMTATLSYRRHRDATEDERDRAGRTPRGVAEVRPSGVASRGSMPPCLKDSASSSGGLQSDHRAPAASPSGSTVVKPTPVQTATATELLRRRGRTPPPPPAAKTPSTAKHPSSRAAANCAAPSPAASHGQPQRSAPAAGVAAAGDVVSTQDVAAVGELPSPQPRHARLSEQAVHVGKGPRLPLHLATGTIYKGRSASSEAVAPVNVSAASCRWKGNVAASGSPGAVPKPTDALARSRTGLVLQRSPIRIDSDPLSVATILVPPAGPAPKPSNSHGHHVHEKAQVGPGNPGSPVVKVAWDHPAADCWSCASGSAPSERSAP